MNITRRKLLVRLVQGLCALPFVGQRIANSQPVHNFMFQQKGWTTLPIAFEECDMDQSMHATGAFLSGILQTMLAECRRDGFVPREISTTWVESRYFDEPCGHFEVTIIRERAG